MKRLFSSLFILILLCTSFVYAEEHQHSLQSLPAVIATCGKSGHTAGEMCSECGEIISGLEEIPALTHVYGDWKLLKDSTQHQATCKNVGCRQKLTVDCFQYKFVLDALEHTVCPVCGASCADSRFSLVTDVVVTAPEGKELPAGKLVVQGSVTPFSGRVIYSFTLAWESNGEVVDFEYPLTVTIPLKVVTESKTQLTLRYAFGEDRSTKAENKLYNYTWEDSAITFTTDRAGIYTLSTTD